MRKLCVPGAVAVLFLSCFSLAAQAPRFDVGSPVLADLWVDGAAGNDENDGRTPATAVATLRAAWRRIPEGPLTGTGWRIRIQPGLYTGAYLESRHGTLQHPIVIEPAEGRGTVTFAPAGGNGGNVTLFDVSYVYVTDLSVSVPGGDAFQCERCDHVLFRRVTLKSRWTEGQDETLKLNQSTHIFVEDSDIGGAGDNAIDAVGVQGGHVVGNRIHGARDWCIYLKGGSASIRVEGNSIYDCGTGGFTAGQGSGFQFMVAPFLHYEAYDLRFVNNVVRDTDGAGIGVNGGYDILLAHNTLVRTGRRSHLLELVYGHRSCDGPAGAPGREACTQYLGLGGWGTTVVDDGSNFARIPNRNVFVLDNVFWNPPTWRAEQLFTIFGPYSGPWQDGSNIPVPARADENAVIAGTVIWNGGPGAPLGVGDDGAGCQGSHPTCNPAQLRASNAIDTLEPRLAAPEAGDARPLSTSGFPSAPLAAFPGGDAPTRPALPSFPLQNSVATDAWGEPRTQPPVPGALLPSARTFTQTRLVPIVLSASGAGGSFFTSELVLTNRGRASVTATLDYTAAFGGGTGTATEALGPYRQLVIPDAIAWLQSKGVPLPAEGSRGGTLRVTFSGLASPGDGAATVRTTTPVPSGRAGLSYAGLSPSRLLSGAAFIPGLRQNDRDRSNVALVNAGTPADGPVTLRLTVHDGDGSGSATVLPDETLAPGGFLQLSGVLGTASVRNGWVRVARVSGRAPWTAYGVVNDQATSDGSFVEAIPEAAFAGRAEALLPVVVEAGAFTSEVVLTNATPSARRLRLRCVAPAITAPGNAAELSVDLAPWQQLVLPSFFAWLRERGAAGVGQGGLAGPLFVLAQEGETLAGFLAGARTSAAGDGGSFGLFTAAVPQGEAVTGSVFLYGLRQDETTRTNLALVNTGERDDTISSFTIDLFDGDTGVRVASVPAMVGPRGFLQVGAILAAHAPGTRNGWARVTRESGLNPFVAYAVVNDGGAPGERSGDGAFVAMETTE